MLPAANMLAAPDHSLTSLNDMIIVNKSKLQIGNESENRLDFLKYVWKVEERIFDIGLRLRVVN